MPHTLENAVMSKGEFHGKWYNGHIGPPYMNSLILPHLRRREKKLNKKYDAIFDSRPDVLPIRQRYYSEIAQAAMFQSLHLNPIQYI